MPQHAPTPFFLFLFRSALATCKPPMQTFELLPSTQSCSWPRHAKLLLAEVGGPARQQFESFDDVARREKAVDAAREVFSRGARECGKVCVDGWVVDAAHEVFSRGARECGKECSGARANPANMRRMSKLLTDWAVVEWKAGDHVQFLCYVAIHDNWAVVEWNAADDNYSDKY
ncbi:hypothetical protein T492DRAFT_840732 [Pavlovales sp. CCMP2436]|nr:hypothetical protein T492DRAFT_840732 [Pavlovales sp. CCMP2436]